MKIAIGADHAGLALKQQVAEWLKTQGHEIDDAGTHSSESTDYPDYAAMVARSVASGAAERGILVCGTGIGMSIAANKINGIRAALAVNPEEVHLTRQHNNANVLALSANYTTPQQATEFVRLFLATPFDGGRHERRVNKISNLERK
jgi:ribose 5-phosphate isomerase B